MRRIVGISLLWMLVVVGGVAAAAPSGVPNKVEITDPAADANYLNDQAAWVLGTPAFGDASAASVIAEADILNVWFTNDAKTLSVHMQTASPPPARVPLFFMVKAHPIYSLLGGEIRCIQMYALIKPDAASGRAGDNCDRPVEPTEATVDIATLQDGTGVITITAPRSASEYFGRNGVLIAPLASSHNTTAGVPVTVNMPVIDNTKPGRDYSIRR